MKIIVSGSRDHTDKDLIWRTLDEIHARKPITVLVHGGARGADSIAANWAKAHDIEDVPYPANWHQWHYSAGPIRNRQMLKENLDAELLVAFPLPRSKGTLDMIEITEQAGIECLTVKP